MWRSGNGETLKIAGILDDSVWQHTPTFTGFTQQDPKEGEPATELTTVQVVYDDEALYIGAMAYDQQPDNIVARLTRRDRWTEADWVSVHLDLYHDHQMGNFFYINAAAALGECDPLLAENRSAQDFRSLCIVLTA